MTLRMRKTSLASPAYLGRADFTIYDQDHAIGRIFKDRTRPELRWFWSITMIGVRHAGIQTDGHSPTLEQAQAELQTNWRKWLVSAKLEQQE